MSVEKNLGTLIQKLNPYSGGRAMHFAHAQPTQAPAPTPIPNANGVNLSMFSTELETGYVDSWSFKGQQRKINTAARIMYRWPKFDDNNQFVCWVTDYLLIGFEGAGGGS